MVVNIILCNYKYLLFVKELKLALLQYEYDVYSLSKRFHGYRAIEAFIYIP